MQSVPGVRAPVSSVEATASQPHSKAADATISSKYAIEEIVAYIVIRDGLLADAEGSPTCEALRRAAIANDFVESCLEPPRPPYEAQCLPQLDAVRERQRCEDVKRTIAQLSAR